VGQRLKASPAEQIQKQGGPMKSNPVAQSNDLNNNNFDVMKH
jgi:hypothetical protein